MKQQTALEWLIKEFNLEAFQHTIHHALELEKQQIADAYESGQKETANGYYIRLGEQFYNKNYSN